MKKKLLISVCLVLFCVFSVFAANWYEGQIITRFELQGIKNISVPDVDNVLYPYRGKQYSDSVRREIETKLYAISGVDYIETEAKRETSTDELVLSYTFHELPMVGTVTFTGNDKVKNTDLVECLSKITAGSFVDLNKKSVEETAKSEILTLYRNNGFDTVDSTMKATESSKQGIWDVEFTVVEGTQSRIVEIAFTGNNNITSSLLKKQLDSKKKSLLEKGFYIESTAKSDCKKITDYYKNSGYLDIIVGEPTVDDVSTGKKDYREVKLTFNVVEGSLWHFGGLEITGNTVFTDQEIQDAVGDSLVVGDVLNYNAVQKAVSAVNDLYYNNGYVSEESDVKEEKDDTDMSVKFSMTITENTQSILEKITFSGLKKTKEKVMRRELEFNEGDVFSKKKLTTSAQNLYNTGLLSDIDYNLTKGETDNGVNLDFELTEGSTMDIQFGATFGGNATGFPISGFLSWSNNNFRGLAQSLSVSTTLSPDSQSLSLSFGDDWFLGKRWSNSFSFSFSRDNNSSDDALELQLGTGSEPYDGEAASFPKPFQSYADYDNKKSLCDISDSDKMPYEFYSLSLGYNTGYKWIFDAGRLGLSGGLSFGFNRAVYDSCYTPYRKILQQYGEKWQMSNKLSLSLQWDGRDYVKNTTKGYVVGLTGTTAGGLLGGLSNYNKLSFSAAGYQKIIDITGSDGTVKPLMLCASTSASVMLPQYWKYKNNTYSWQEAYKGTTQDEMLYIDGMTIARGHDFTSYQSVLWDNMLELSYQLVEGVFQAEAFVSGTYLHQYRTEEIGKSDSDGWYLAAGAGIKLKVSGFPLGFYIVEDMTMIRENNFKFNVCHPSNEFGNSGLAFVLAISTSLI